MESSQPSGYRHFLYHKPAGVVCTRVDSWPPKNGSRTTVYQEIEMKGFPTDVGMVGRLDAETSGVLLFTDDSKLNRAIADPYKGDVSNVSSFHTKMYLVTVTGVRQDLLSENNQELKELLEAEMSAPLTFSQWGFPWVAQAACEVRVQDVWQGQYQNTKPGAFTAQISVVLFEGKNHQVRRLCYRSGLKVKHLHRQSIAGILTDDSVPNPGDIRWLTVAEVEQLYSGFELRVTN